MKLKLLTVAVLSAMIFSGCVSEQERLARAAAEREYQEWLTSDDGPKSGSVSIEEFSTKYKAGWRERAATKKAVRLEHEALEREYIEWLASDDGPRAGNRVTMEEFKSKYKVGWRERAATKKAERLAKENRTKLCESIAANSLEQIRKAYADREKYVNPFPRKDRRRSGEDWLKSWTGPRRDLSEEDRLAGDALLSEFGTKYLPNAYANYEKARDAALELQQVFNEEFPEPWTITSTSPKWSAFNKVLEKFAKVRTEYFLCRDELCHYWLAHRLGGLSAEDFAKIDSQRLAVDLLSENEKLIGALILKVMPMDVKYRDFASKYAPESFAAYQKLERELKEVDRLLAEVCTQLNKIDFVHFDTSLRAITFKQNDLVREMNLLLLAFQTWQSLHRTTVMSSEEVAKNDHDTALRLKPFIGTLPTYVKEYVRGPIIPKSDMIAIPGKDFRIQRTEVTQKQWQAVMGDNPSEIKGDCNPVENVSWKDCKVFLEKLNALPEVKASGLTYRLPSEEEWEYACRAGSTADWGRRMNGEEGPLDVMGWYGRNSGRGHHPVAMKEPNAFGLYDMHGNVREWCEDLYQAGDSHRVYRGGGWYNSSRDCAAGFRCCSRPDLRSNYCLGFRLAASQDVNR